MTNHKSQITNCKSGSILIWTVLLGVALSSAFFFFAVRLGNSGIMQRAAVEKQGAKAFLESYADYITSLKSSDPSALEAMAGDFHFDEIAPSQYLINGTLTKELDVITGTLDSGEPITFNFSGTINVDWNLCTSNQKGNIEINGIVYEHDDTAGNECSPTSAGYDDPTSTVGINVPNPFTIKAVDAPFHFRITSSGAGTQLVDTKWHLNAEIELGYGRKVEVEKTF